MRLSIDVRAIKDHNFTAQFYVKYASIAELGVRHFKSSPAMPLTTIKMETSLNNCFGFYNFEASSTDL